MASLNKVLLMGNLTRDPQLRYTTSGLAVCELGLAMNRRYTTSQGEDREETCFVDIEVWAKQAEACGNNLHKGSPVLVEGRLKLDQWEDRQTGQRRSRLRVSAERVQFLGSPRPREEEGAGGPPPPTQQEGRRGQRPGPGPAAPAGPVPAPPPPPFPSEPGDSSRGPALDSGRSQAPAPPASAAVLPQPQPPASPAAAPPQPQPQPPAPPPPDWSQPAGPAGPSQGDDIDDDIPF